LQAVRTRNLPIEGTLSASASGSGTIKDPQLTANIQIPQLQLQQTAATGVKAQLNVAGHRADITLASDVAQATLRGKASVDLTGNYYTVGSLDTTKIPLSPLLATYVTSVPNDLSSDIELHATVKGPLKDKTKLEAHVVIPTLSAKYQQLEIAGAGPIRIDYANSVVTIEPSQLTGTETSIRFQGRVPVQGSAGIDVTAQGSVNLRLLRLLSPDLRSSGTIALDVRGTGNPRQPGVEGQIKVQKVSLITSDAPLGVENLNGVLDLGNGRIQLTDLKGQAGGGNISIGGSIAYQPHLQFDLAINAQSVRLLYPDGIRSQLDGNIAVTGTPQASSVDGRVLINGLSFTPDFDLANFMSQSGSGTVATSSDSFTSHMKLNLAVQSTENLQAVSSEVSVEGQANLRVIGTAAEPVIVGRADLNAGDIFFMKNRYHLERGMINFINPNRTEPTVNILISTVIQQYNLSLSLVGPVDKLRTSYTSDPPLPPVDIINLVARGSTTEQSSPGNFDANQVLAAGLASQVSSRIGKLAGISSLTIDPLLGGANGNPSARVAVQQRLTKNFIFTFSTDVTQPEAEIIQGEYQISKHWSVSATRDQYGGFAFDGRFHKTF
jgi:translocation and assembly module TamB